MPKVTGQEFSDALAQLARSQYEIERDTYYNMAENYTMAKTINNEKIQVKVDTREVLRDREDFHYNLLLKVQGGPGGTQNIETEMYKSLLSDYYGKGKAENSLSLAKTNSLYELSVILDENYG